LILQPSKYEAQAVSSTSSWRKNIRVSVVDVGHLTSYQQIA
jgi:hypothetical protein